MFCCICGLLSPGAVSFHSAGTLVELSVTQKSSVLIGWATQQPLLFTWHLSESAWACISVTHAKGLRLISNNPLYIFGCCDLLYYMLKIIRWPTTQTRKWADRQKRQNKKNKQTNPNNHLTLICLVPHSPTAEDSIGSHCRQNWTSKHSMYCRRCSPGLRQRVFYSNDTDTECTLM